MASGGSLNITEEGPHCTPCVSKGKKVGFYKYCLDCEAHYCTECFELHPRVPFLAKHTVLSKDDEKRWSRIPYKCKTHGRTIEFFCTIHNKVACQICINLQHRKCEIDFIPECSKEISTNRKLTSTVEQIGNIIETARNYEENFEKKSQTNQYSKQSFLETLSDFRHSINGLLDGLERVTKKSMEQRFEDNTRYFNDSIRELRKLKDELEELKSDLTTTSKEKEVLVFIRYTEGIEKVKEAEKKIAELDTKSNKEQFTLVIDGKLEQLLKSLTSFGCIIDEQNTASDDLSPSEFKNGQSVLESVAVVSNLDTSGGQEFVADAYNQHIPIERYLVAVFPKSDELVVDTSYLHKSDNQELDVDTSNPHISDKRKLNAVVSSLHKPDERELVADASNLQSKGRFIKSSRVTDMFNDANTDSIKVERASKMVDIQQPLQTFCKICGTECQIKGKLCRVCGFKLN